MKFSPGYRPVLIFPLILACSLFSPTAEPTAGNESPTAAAAPTGTLSAGLAPSATSTGPTPDACSPEALRVYLRQFVMPMAGYEMGLIQVYNITSASNGSASGDQYQAALSTIQSARDSIAGLQPPECAQQMQSDMLTSMDDMKAALELKITGASTSQFEAAMAKEKAEQKTAEDEFGALSAQAGLDAPSPTP